MFANHDAKLNYGERPLYLLKEVDDKGHGDTKLELSWCQKTTRISHGP